MDTCICPKCNTKLDVSEYGYNLQCSDCHCRIDVFPETDLYLETPYGDIGIALKGWKRWILSLIALLVNKNMRQQ